MPIYQTNTFICEFCGRIISTTEEVNLYDDPTIMPPNNEQWDYVNDGLACQDCFLSK
jgi:hypothetical protein